MSAIREQWDAGVAAYNAGQVERLADGYADDAVWINPRGTYTGRTAILERMREALAPFPDSQMKTVSWMEDGDTAAAVVYEVAGTHTAPLTMPDGRQIPPTGQRLTFSAASVFTLVDGKVTEQREFYDRLAIMMQLGLLPSA